MSWVAHEPSHAKTSLPQPPRPLQSPSRPSHLRLLSLRAVTFANSRVRSISPGPPRPGKSGRAPDSTKPPSALEKLEDALLHTLDPLPRERDEGLSAIVWQADGEVILLPHCRGRVFDVVDVAAIDGGRERGEVRCEVILCEGWDVVLTSCLRVLWGAR